MRNVKAQHMAFTGCRQKNATQHTDGGTLAGTIGAEECKDLPLINRESDVVDRDEVTKALGQVAHIDHGCGEH